MMMVNMHGGWVGGGRVDGGWVGGGRVDGVGGRKVDRSSN